jgi:SAM-dependent methyltransferase
VDKKKKKTWFEDWFNTPYYHALYGHRSQEEADGFISSLEKAHLKGYEFIADVGCGKGRHSSALRSIGHQVIGYDLSPESIAFANANYAKEGLEFLVQDMRNPLPHAPFDAVVNLFTSFGYFETDVENQKVMQNFYNALRVKGLFVMDYLHPSTIKLTEGVFEIEKEGFVFQISKAMNNGFINKDIIVKEAGEIVFETQERVRIFQQEELPNMIRRSGFTIIATYGDYELNPLTETSSRQIFICHKE